MVIFHKKERGREGRRREAEGERLRGRREEPPSFWKNATLLCPSEANEK